VAQTPSQPAEDEVLRVNTNLILFPARIRDQAGQRPNGLTGQDLLVKDPDRVTTSLYLSAGVDRVAIVFALDESGSVAEIINEQRDAALGLYQRFGSKSSIAVLHFAGTPQIVAAFTRDTTAARSAFEVRVRANQHTAIFDAADKTLTMFDALRRVRSERRIVILISDGLDNASRTKARSVIESAREKAISFYVIHLPLFEPRDGRLAVRRPASGFRELAEKTGGKYFLVRDTPFSTRDKIDLTPVFQAIEDDLRTQYLVGFYLNEKAHDGKLHHLSLSLPPGIEYQVGDRGYANTHKFVVH
jgi:Ca-activated chloride channel family protein